LFDMCRHIADVPAHVTDVPSHMKIFDVCRDSAMCRRTSRGVSR
jgi:hypothetical protein